MAKLVLTAIGDDREGLVSALSAVVDAHGGNWLDSQFARLAGTFAGIVLVDVPADRADAFQAAAADLRREVGWKVEVTRGEAADPVGDPLRLHLLGQDRTGMVREITAALADQRVTIDDFRSWTRDAPEGGGVLFEAEALVRLPDGLDEVAVRQALEPIADELMVDLEFGAEVSISA